jgi:hypothetical protein
MAVDIFAGQAGERIVQGAMGPTIEFAGTEGMNYLVERHEDRISTRPFAPVDGKPGSAPRKLGNVQIGLFGDGQ